MATPLRQPEVDRSHDRTRLVAVSETADQAAGGAGTRPADEIAEEVPFESGLLKTAAIGGTIGFVIVFVLAGLSLYYMAQTEVLEAIAGAVFVGAFGGLGGGAMMAASLHQH